MDEAQHLKLYREMRRIRLVEEAIANNYYNDVREMHTPVHLCDGQEAIAVGICSQLNEKDMIFSNHRSHGHYLAKGGDLNAMIAELHGKVTGCCKGKGGSMHLCDLNRGIMLTSAIVAGNVSVATGFAMAQKKRHTGIVSVVFFGDGASEEGSVYESICFAAKEKLPILYVCENNRVAISTPYELREPNLTVSSKFETLLPAMVVDGNNVEDVYERGGDCLKRIRNGKGPCFMECRTYRLRAHSNIGDGVDGIYRKEEDQVKARENDPVECFKEQIMNERITTEEDLAKMDESVKAEIMQAFTLARAAALPDKEDLFRDVCA